MLEILFQLEFAIAESDILMIDLRLHPDLPDLSLLTFVMIPGIVDICTVIQRYLELAKARGVRDIDDMQEF